MCNLYDIVSKSRISQFVKLDENTGCWEWSGPKLPNGYPYLPDAGKNMSATRAVRNYAGIPVQDSDSLITNKCGNRNCVSPLHNTITEEQILSLIKINPDTGCHEYQGKVSNFGHGKAFDKGKPVWVHRWMWERKRGPIPDGMLVRHLCSNAKCCNVEHLALGSQLENMRDMIEAERQATGERHGSKTHPGRVARGEQHGSKTKPARVARGERAGAAKLNDATVLEIRNLYHDTEVTQKELATKFGIDQTVISEILTGKSWKHVGGPLKESTRKGKRKAGKFSKGEAVSGAKLNEKTVREIRKMRSSGMSFAAIGKSFSVHYSTVADICQGRTWTHVTDHPEPPAQPAEPVFDF